MEESSDKDLELNIKIVQGTNKRTRKKIERLREEKKEKISNREKRYPKRSLR